jgi:hypothetical protein
MGWGKEDGPMTDAEWLTNNDPRRMLAFLAGIPERNLFGSDGGEQLSDRKLRLFGLAWCRFFRSSDEDLRAIEMSERHADGKATFEQVAAAWAFMGGRMIDSTGWEGAVELVHYGAWDIGSAQSDEACDRARAAFLRDIFGNPFQPVFFDPSLRRWNSGAAVALAQEMYNSRNFSKTPLLADMLEDAGCTDPAILEHLRGSGLHVRGCWVLDLLLAKS